MLPIPSPPIDLGSWIDFHATNDIAFFSESPLHRNALVILLIFSITFFGMGNNDMKYRGRFDSDDFMSVILPPIDSILPFHNANFFAILSITGSHA